MKIISITVLIVLLASLAHAQHTTVTAQVKDTNGSIYSSCTGSASFVGQNSIPGAGPYLLNGSPFQTVVPIFCDGAGNFLVSLADNNMVSPTPSQWNFTICTAIGAFPGSPICFNVLITITGTTQNVTSQITAAATILPTGGGGGSITLKHNGVTNGSQTLLNLIQGTNITITDDGVGGITINSSGGGGGGTPGTPFTSLQFNNSGSFAGTSAQNGTTQSSYNSTTGELDIPNLANHRYVIPGVYDWLRTDVAGSVGNLAAAGAGKVLTLAPCPLGFDPTITAQFPYAVYIAGTGTPEVAVLTAGTGTAGSASCTATVTTVNTHSAGFTVGSANGGVQEAWNDGAPQVSTNQNHPDIWLVSNTIYNIRYPVILHGRGGTLWGYGAQFYCFTRGSCLIIGSAQLGSIGTYQRVFGLTLTSKNNVDGAQITNAVAAAGTFTITTNTNHNLVPGDKADVWFFSPNANQHAVITVATTPDTTHFTYVLGSTTFGSTSAWGTVVLGNFAIENNSNGVIVRDVNTFNVTGNDYFSYAIVNDNDQAFTIDGYKNRASASVRCGVNFCGYQIYQRGDQGNSGIIFVTNSELSMQCNGNGILFASGNGSGVSNTVIQGFAQSGVYTVNGLQGTKLDQVYEEVGSCNNPYYPTPLFAGVGLYSASNITHISGPLPIVGQTPQFANTGSNNRNYYIIPKSSVNGVGPTLLAGFAKTNGAGNVVVAWPQLPGNSSSTITYDLLLTTCDRGSLCNSPAYGAGAATSLTTASSGVTCALGFCQFTDTHAAGSAYTLAAQQYAPYLPWWPGGITLTNSADVSSVGSVGQLYAWNITSTSISGINTSAGALVPTIFASKCPNFGAWVPVWVVCPGGDQNGTGIFSTVFNQADGANNGPGAHQIGRLSLGPLTGTPPFHLIELMDRNFSGTMTQPGMRGIASSLNTYIGTDATDQLSIGSRNKISFYLANEGDNSAFLERLEPTLKTFKISTLALPTANNVVPLTAQCGSGAAGSQACLQVKDQGGTVALQVNSDDSVNLGAGSTKSITTTTASNTDLTGELVFSGGTTSTSYTFTGTYVSHPECSIGPQFDFGANRIWWSTISTTTLQLSSNAAQTGNVSYVCIGRN